MLKKIMLTSLIASSFLLSSFQSQALDVTPRLSDDGVLIMDVVQNTLEYNFSDSEKLRLFEKIFKPYSDKAKWNIKPINKTNYLESKAKIPKNDVHFADYVFSIDDRTVFISLINYPHLKHLSITVREVVPISSTNVIDFYTKKMSDKSSENTYDTANYSMFSSKENVSYTNYHVNNSNGVVMYSYSNVFDY